MNQKTKQIIIILVVIIIAFIGFKMFFADQETGNTTLITDQTTTGQFVDGQTILVLLDNLNKITLDESVFSDKIFTSLVSFERPIADQIIGRPNPFLPIGLDGSSLILPKGTSTAKTK